MGVISSWHTKAVSISIAARAQTSEANLRLGCRNSLLDSPLPGLCSNEKAASKQASGAYSQYRRERAAAAHGRHKAAGPGAPALLCQRLGSLHRVVQPCRLHAQASVQSWASHSWRAAAGAPGTAPTAPKSPVPHIRAASHSTVPRSVRLDPVPALVQVQSCDRASLCAEASAAGCAALCTHLQAADGRDHSLRALL